MSPAHQMTTWCLNVIGILSELPLMLFDKMDIGKTNAAHPSNKSRMMIPKILMDVLKLAFDVFHLSMSRASIPT